MALTSHRAIYIVLCKLLCPPFSPVGSPPLRVMCFSMFLKLTKHVQALGLNSHFLILQAGMILSELSTWLLTPFLHLSAQISPPQKGLCQTASLRQRSPSAHRLTLSPALFLLLALTSLSFFFCLLYFSPCQNWAPSAQALFLFCLLLVPLIYNGV